MDINVGTGFSSIISAGLDLIGRFIPDTNAQAAAKAEFQLAVLKGDQEAKAEQADIDKTEATNSNVFVSGWRPAIGWICGIALGWNFIVMPFLGWASLLMGAKIFPPTLDLTDLMTLLLGLLGLGAMRSYDKTQGTSNGH